jgi:hypothetical protein
MQTNLERTDRELENLLGNLLITEYQAEKLKERISKHLSNSGSKQKKISENLFKYKNNWYRIVIEIDQVDSEST